MFLVHCFALWFALDDSDTITAHVQACLGHHRATRLHGSDEGQLACLSLPGLPYTTCFCIHSPQVV